MQCRDQQIPSDQGNEAGSQNAATRAECQEQCRLNSQCNAVAYGESMCYMKEGFDPGVVEWSESVFDFCWHGCPPPNMVLTGSVCDLLHSHQLSASLANFQELPPSPHRWFHGHLAPWSGVCHTQASTGAARRTHWAGPTYPCTTQHP